MKLETIGSSALRRLLGCGISTIRKRVNRHGSYYGIKPVQSGVGKELRFDAKQLSAAYLRGDFDKQIIVKPAGERISAEEYMWIEAIKNRRAAKVAAKAAKAGAK